MKCADCKHYKMMKFHGLPLAVRWCSWHESVLNIDDELDSAEKDCLGFEKRS